MNPCGDPRCVVCGNWEPVMSEKAQDPVVEANRQLLLERSNVGMKKYGKGLGNPLYLTQRQALVHALEEALDLANYLQAEIQRIDAEDAALRAKDVACTHLTVRWNLFFSQGQCLQCGKPVNWRDGRVQAD